MVPPGNTDCKNAPHVHELGDDAAMQCLRDMLQSTRETVDHAIQESASIFMSLVYVTEFERFEALRDSYEPFIDSASAALGRIWSTHPWTLEAPISEVTSTPQHGDDGMSQFFQMLSQMSELVEFLGSVRRVSKPFWKGMRTLARLNQMGLESLSAEKRREVRKHSKNFIREAIDTLEMVGKMTTLMKCDEEQLARLRARLLDGGEES